MWADVLVASAVVGVSGASGVRSGIGGVIGGVVVLGGLLMGGLLVI